LMGDAVDGIPGVQGVGPKTAAKLLSEHGSVDVIYEKLDSIASIKLRDRLADAENDVRRNQQLVGLKKIPQWDESLSDLRPKPRDVVALEDLYRKWNFKSKLEELEEFPF